MSNLNVIRGREVQLTEELHLVEFNAALEEDYLSVWLNVDVNFWSQWQVLMEQQGDLQSDLEQLSTVADAGPEMLKQQMQGLNERRERLTRAIYEFLAKFWGCAVEDVETIFETSPRLYGWCIRRSFAMLVTYNADQKK